jgi:hypothetical protein
MVTYHCVRDHKYIEQVTCLLRGALSRTKKKVKMCNLKPDVYIKYSSNINRGIWKESKCPQAPI